MPSVQKSEFGEAKPDTNFPPIFLHIYAPKQPSKLVKMKVRKANANEVAVKAEHGKGPLTEQGMSKRNSSKGRPATRQVEERKRRKMEPWRPARMRTA